MLYPEMTVGLAIAGKSVLRAPSEEFLAFPHVREFF